MFYFKAAWGAHYPGRRRYHFYTIIEILAHVPKAQRTPRHPHAKSRNNVVSRGRREATPSHKYQRVWGRLSNFSERSVHKTFVQPSPSCGYTSIFNMRIKENISPGHWQQQKKKKNEMVPDMNNKWQMKEIIS